METLKKKVAVTKTLDGELMFLTHPYITIIAKKDKLLCFAKTETTQMKHTPL